MRLKIAQMGCFYLIINELTINELDTILKALKLMSMDIDHIHHYKCKG